MLLPLVLELLPLVLPVLELLLLVLVLLPLVLPLVLDVVLLVLPFPPSPELLPPLDDVPPASAVGSTINPVPEHAKERPTTPATRSTNKV